MISTTLSPLAFDQATLDLHVGDYRIQIERVGPTWYRVEVFTATNHLARQFRFSDETSVEAALAYRAELATQVQEWIDRPAKAAAERQRQADIAAEKRDEAFRHITLSGPKLKALGVATLTGFVPVSEHLHPNTIMTMDQAGLIEAVSEPRPRPSGRYAGTMVDVVVGARITERGANRFWSTVQHDADMHDISTGAFLQLAAA